MPTHRKVPVSTEQMLLMPETDRAHVAASSDQRTAGKQSKWRCCLAVTSSDPNETQGLTSRERCEQVPGSQSKCEYTQITHANPGGALDPKAGAFLANAAAAAAGGPIEVLASLRDVTSKMAK
eukprot:2124321-Rhodomonas_salina.2